MIFFLKIKFKENLKENINNNGIKKKWDGITLYVVGIK